MFISRALQRAKGNLGNAADLLGLHRNTIARKIAEYGSRRKTVVPRPLPSALTAAVSSSPETA